MLLFQHNFVMKLVDKQHIEMHSAVVIPCLILSPVISRTSHSSDDRAKLITKVAYLLLNI